MMFYGGCTLLCMGMQSVWRISCGLTKLHDFLGVGYVVGPSLGSSVWRLVNRNSVTRIDALDREFYKHVARNRVDASLQSATNPIPDYYGEPTLEADILRGCCTYTSTRGENRLTARI